MNKKLIAAAVAAAVAGPGVALAQPASNTPTSIVPSPGVASNAGITLYGRLDETIMYDKYSDSAPNAAGVSAAANLKKGDIYSPGNAMGVRGREDLGGGTSAWFQLEIGVWPSERLDTSTVTGNNWGGRNSAIGLTTGIGDILLGNWDTPYKQVFGVWNSVTSGGFSAAGITMGGADSTGALNNVLCNNTVSNATGSIAQTAPSVATCATEATASSTAWSRRINNSVQYWTPIMGGFQVKLMTAMAPYQAPSSSTALLSGTQKPQEYSANATWARGPLSLGLGYDYHKGLRPSTLVGGEPNPKDSALQLGAKWNFGPGEIGAGYEVITYGNNLGTNTVAGITDNGMKVPTYVLNGRWNIGPGAIWGSYSASDTKSCSTSNTAATTIGTAVCSLKAKMYSLGYDYVLSKRTKMYLAYNKIDNGQGTLANGNAIGTTSYYIAGPATNNGNGNAGGAAAGVDVTTYGFGIQHVF
jgi:predicted porin